MTDLIRSEWIKFRSVRSTLVTLVLAGALVVLVALLQANEANSSDATTTRCETVAQAQEGTTVQSRPDPTCGEGSLLVTRPEPADLSKLVGGVSLAALLFGVLGVQVIGQEYRFSTIRPTFTAAPRRLRVLVAKLVVVTSACAVVAAAMVALCWVVGTVMVDSFSVDGVDRRIAWGIVVFTVLWTTAGMGLGAIVRQPIAAIMILAGYSLVAENLLAAIVDGTGRWLPFLNGFQMTQRDPGGQLDLRPVLEGGLYFAGACLLVWAIGAALVERRDA